MKTQLKSITKQAFKTMLVFSLICGIGYTALLTSVAQVFFPNQANGSILTANGKVYGSELLGQYQTAEKYLWGRVTDIDIKTHQDNKGNPLMYASPSNASPASDTYERRIKNRIQEIRDKNPQMKNSSVPVDLVTGSASGLDPHISPAAATYQIPRIAKMRGKSYQEIKDIIDRCTTGRFFGVFGEPTVNVLKVNLMLDRILKD